MKLLGLLLLCSDSPSILKWSSVLLLSFLAHPFWRVKYLNPQSKSDERSNRLQSNWSRGTCGVLINRCILGLADLEENEEDEEENNYNEDDDGDRSDDSKSIS